MRLRPLIPIAALAAATIAPAALAQPSPAQIEAAKKAAADAADAALDAFEAGRYAEAIAGFEKANTAFHAPKFLLYVARARARLGQLVAAKATYEGIGREKLPVYAPVEFFRAQADAKKELAELTPRIPVLTVQARGGITGALLDGKAVPLDQGIPVDPGEHTLTGAGQGVPGARLTLSIAERETRTAVLEPSAGAAPSIDPPPVTSGQSPPGLFSSMPVPTYVAYGAGALGLVVGGVFSGLTLAKKGEHDALLAADPVDARQANDAAAQGRAFAAVTDVGLALALAGAATGTIWWIVAPRPAGASGGRSHPGPRVFVAPGVGGLAAFGRF